MIVTTVKSKIKFHCLVVEWALWRLAAFCFKSCSSRSCNLGVSLGWSKMWPWYCHPGSSLYCWIGLCASLCLRYDPSIYFRLQNTKMNSTCQDDYYHFEVLGCDAGKDRWDLRLARSGRYCHKSRVGVTHFNIGDRVFGLRYKGLFLDVCQEFGVGYVP